MSMNTDMLASTSTPIPSGSGSRKRKLSADNAIVEQPNAKCVSVDQPNHERRTVHLMDLSDEMLVQIFINLDNYSVLNLLQTNTRLKRIALDRKLWIDVDFTSVKLAMPELIRRLKYLHHTTLSLRYEGVTSNSLRQIWETYIMNNPHGHLHQLERKCPLLERLEITETYLDETLISLETLPKSLRSLVLRRCETSPSRHAFLHNIYKHLPKLERLSVEYCNWFEAHDIMVLAKLPNLQYLSLKGCNFKESVPYASIAARFGFQKLEKLDLRDTPVSDSDVSCFNIVHPLKELLLECPEQLRTERGLSEYNEQEQQRMERLHREFNNENALMHPNIIIRINQVPPPRGARENYRGDNFQYADLGPPIDLQEEERRQAQEPAPVDEQRPPPVRPQAPVPIQIQIEVPARVPARLAAQVPEPAPAVEPPRVQANNDRQHIVRIINRELLNQGVWFDHDDGQAHPYNNNNNENNDNENNNNNDVPAGARDAVPVRNRPMLEVAYRQIFHQRNRSPELNREPRLRMDREIHNNGNDVVRLQNMQPVPGPPSPPPRQASSSRQTPQSRQAPPPRPAPPPRQEPAVQPQREPDDVNPRLIDQGQGANAGEGQQNVHMPNIFVMRDAVRRPDLFVRRIRFAGHDPLDYVPLVSDRGICGYGVARNEPGCIRRLMDHSSLLERLLIRHYKLVTDTTLEHLETAAPHLKILDVTGTSVTAEGVRNFKQACPNCTVISDFDNAVPASTTEDSGAAASAAMSSDTATTTNGATGSPAPEDGATGSIATPEDATASSTTPEDAATTIPMASPPQK